jgi:8-oxo-dGTP pyrophosphatase MutT (NUDIX family)
VLLMQRAVRDGDRWSGHVSFPGGREEPSDRDLLATAIRETREEVGVDLASDAARFLGRLAPQRAIAQGLPLPMTITPFVFAMHGDVTVAMGGEATATFWLPLDAAASGALDGVHPYKLGPLMWRFPCWRHDGRVVWGLTFEMLKRLLSVIRE